MTPEPGGRLARRAVLAGLTPAWPARAGDAPLDRPGTVVLLRHAEAPGFGDPPGARADDCATQRNLSAEGRAQAARIGAALRARLADGGAAAVLHAERCRCRDTAVLLGLGAARHTPELDSLFGQQAQTDPRTVALQALIAAHPGPWPLVLVTHQVNVAALTGISPASGEAVLLDAADPGRPLRRIPPA